MTGHCRDCGEALDQFGICPFADPEVARLASAPVHCGKSPQQNAAEVAVVIDSAIAAPSTPLSRTFIPSRISEKLPNFMGIAGDQSVNSRGSGR